MHNTETGLRSTIDRIEILKVIAHPVRVKILKELATGRSSPTR